MQEVVFTQGLPGSGKSTWAKKYVLDCPNYIRVCRDDLRNMRGKYMLPEQENLITQMEHGCIRSALQSKFNVIVDATNFKESYMNQAKKLALEINPDIQFRIKSFTDVSLDECIKRDRHRENPVGEKVIREFYDRYVRQKFQVIKGSIPAIICDLDGTLAIHNGRSPYDEEKCDTDLVNETVKQIILNYLERNLTNKILFVSGRQDVVYQKTYDWLMFKAGFSEFDLFMRKTKDNRNDTIVKREIFMEHINGKYDIKFVLDDRNRVVEMWRNDLGLTCLQVADGDF